MDCPKCGAENQPDAEYCSLCLTSLVPSSRLYESQQYGVADYAPSEYVPPALGGSPSDWHIERPYDQGVMDESGSFQKRRARSRLTERVGGSTFILLLILLLVAGFAVGGYYTVNYILKLFNTDTYASVNTALRFSYPKGWVKIQPSELAKYIGSEKASWVNEIAIVDSKTDPKQIIAVAVLYNADNSDWNTKKVLMTQQMQNNLGVYNSDFHVTKPLKTTDVRVAGNPSMEGKLSVYGSDTELDYRFVVVPRGTKVYMIIYFATDSSINVDGTWQPILESIHFLGED